MLHLGKPLRLWILDSFLLQLLVMKLIRSHPRPNLPMLPVSEPAGLLTTPQFLVVPVVTIWLGFVNRDPDFLQPLKLRRSAVWYMPGVGLLTLKG